VRLSSLLPVHDLPSTLSCLLVSNLSAIALLVAHLRSSCLRRTRRGPDVDEVLMSTAFQLHDFRTSTQPRARATSLLISTRVSSLDALLISLLHNLVCTSTRFWCRQVSPGS